MQGARNKYHIYKIIDKDKIDNNTSLRDKQSQLMPENEEYEKLKKEILQVSGVIKLKLMGEGKMR